MPRQFIGALIFVFWVSFAFSETNQTHCTSGEIIYFSCSAGKKLISVCGSKNLSANSGYLQYRFGPAGKTEITLPPTKDIPAKNFIYSNSTGTMMGSASLSIKSGRFRYDIYEQYSIRGGEDAQGVMVFRDQKEVADVKCKVTSVSEISNMGSIGLPEE